MEASLLSYEDTLIQGIKDAINLLNNGNKKCNIDSSEG